MVRSGASSRMPSDGSPRKAKRTCSTACSRNWSGRRMESGARSWVIDVLQVGGSSAIQVRQRRRTGPASAPENHSPAA